VLTRNSKAADAKNIVGPFRTIHVAVFALGLIAIIALVLAAGQISDSESFLLLAALVSYTVYVISSATLALSVAGAPKWSWAGTYLVAMLPSVLLTSWLPITAAWPADLSSTVPWSVKAIASALSNAAICYGTALVLVWLAKLLARQDGWSRAALFAAAIILPVALWIAEVKVALLSKGLS
jgi:hypothetical protein